MKLKGKARPGLARGGQGPAHEDVPDAATKLSIEVKLAVDGLVAYYFRFLEDVGFVFWHVVVYLVVMGGPRRYKRRQDWQLC